MTTARLAFTAELGVFCTQLEEGIVELRTTQLESKGDPAQGAKPHPRDDAASRMDAPVFHKSWRSRRYAPLTPAWRGWSSRCESCGRAGGGAARADGSRADGAGCGGRLCDA